MSAFDFETNPARSALSEELHKLKQQPDYFSERTQRRVQEIYRILYPGSFLTAPLGPGAFDKPGS